jgi:hypothetical protein
MSKYNKVNKDHYVQRGRLTPDEMARERVRQGTTARPAKEHVIGKTRSSGAQASTRPRNGRGE